MPLLAGLIPLLGILLKMLIVRIILATGLTFVTYAGYLAALEKFKGYTANAINSMPSDILNLLLISGFGQGWAACSAHSRSSLVCTHSKN
ncbi:phage associated protein [Neisseria gonorrhoeae]|nr:phage associated protein [Neisseria gonorrhoeae]